MSVVKILGTSNAIAYPDKENSHLAVIHEGRVVLVDCAGSPIVHLRKAELELDAIDDLILTHFHPDHVGGVPLLLMGMWLKGRSKELHIYGVRHCLQRLKIVMDLYGWTTWPNFFPVRFHVLSFEVPEIVLDKGGLRILSRAVCHIIPTIGLRFENTETQVSVTYSCDTAPCENLMKLADSTFVLIHEANGSGNGHSSAREAAEVAQATGVGKLILTHFNPEQDTQALLASAREVYDGETILAQDMMEIEF